MTRKEFTSRIVKVMIGDKAYREDSDLNWTIIYPATKEESQEMMKWLKRGFYFRYYVTSDGRYIIAEDRDKVQKLLQDLKAAFPEAKSIRKHEVSYTQGQRYRVTIKF